MLKGVKIDINIYIYNNIMISNNNDSNIINSSYDELSKFYDNILNKDKSTYKSSNDEPTPIKCIEEMINKIPTELWERKNLKILVPCCFFKLNNDVSLSNIYFLIWSKSSII